MNTNNPEESKITESTAEQRSAPPESTDAPSTQPPHTPETAARKRHPVLRVLSYILVFLIGMSTTVGLAIGAVWYGYDRVSANTVLKVVYPNYERYITAEFAENSVAGMIRELASGNVRNLSDVRKITPYIDTMMDDLNGALDGFGVTLNREEVYQVYWEDLGTYVSDNVLRSAKLGALLQVTADSDSLMKYLAYGSEGVDYNIVGGEIVLADGKTPNTVGTLLDTEQRTQLINRVRLCDLMTITEDSEPVLQSLKDTRIEDMSEKIKSLTLGEVMTIDEDSSVVLASLKDTPIRDLDDSLNSLTLGEVVEINENSALILQNLKDSTLKTIGDELEELTLCQVVAIDENSTQIMQTLKDTRIKDLNARIEELTLGEVLEIDADSPKILTALSGSKLSGLDDDVDNLTMEQILGEEVFGQNVVLDAIRTSSLATVADDIAVLTVNELFSEQIYDEEGNVIGAWKYFLYEDGVEQVTYLNDVDKMSARVSANVNQAKLSELYEDGMIALDDPTCLDRTVYYGGEFIRIGDMTVSRMIDFVLQLIG